MKEYNIKIDLLRRLFRGKYNNLDWSFIKKTTKPFKLVKQKLKQ